VGSDFKEEAKVENRKPEKPGWVGWKRTTYYEVRDKAGNFISLHQRIEPGDGTKTMPWINRGDYNDFPLYGIDEIDKYYARTQQQVMYLTEGEKARDALHCHGYRAVSTYGTSHTPTDDALEQCRGYFVLCWYDDDANGKGERHMQEIRDRLLHKGIPAELLIWE
jgi:hypothetical protein